MMMWYDVNKMNIIIILQLKKVIPFYLIYFKGAFKWCIIHFNLKHSIICVILFFELRILSHTLIGEFDPAITCTLTSVKMASSISISMFVLRRVFDVSSRFTFSASVIFTLTIESLPRHVSNIQRNKTLFASCPFVFVETQFYRCKASLLLGHWCLIER